MGFLKELVAGVRPSVSERPPVTADANLIVTCCRELSWAAYERLSADKYLLHFSDPLGGSHKIQICMGDQGATMSFTVCSAVRISAKQAPATVLGVLLKQNSEQFAGWQMSIGDDDQISFFFGYCVPTTGLHPGLFKTLCEKMAKKVHDFDSRMHEAGVL
jgi:hypothetical protein